MAKKIAVIGAGASGLTATKCCLDEGLVPVCFERTKDIGGLWRYTEELDERKVRLILKKYHKSIPGKVYTVGIEFFPYIVF